MKCITIFFLLFLASFTLANQTVYTDSLETGWQNWSWATVNFANTSPVHSGKYSISVKETGANQALYLHHNAQPAKGYESLVFWVNGGPSGGQLLQVQGTLFGNAIAPYPLPPLQANTWTMVVVPLKAIGVWGATSFDGFWLQDRSGATEGEFFVDDISLQTKAPFTPAQTVYSDSLLNSWVNWSWALVNLANRSPVKTGTRSVSVSEQKPYDGFYVHHSGLDGTLYSTISFWINGGMAGGQYLQVVGTASGLPQTSFPLPPLAPNTWQLITIPLTALGVGFRGDLDGFWIQGAVDTVQPTYYVDQVQLNVVPITNPVAKIAVDLSARTPISPYIYGLNPPSTAGANWGGLGTGYTLARMGGNRLTAYNWENNASNAGSDYLFENDALMGVTDESGWAQRTFIQAVIKSGAIPLVTIPTAGYVSADKSPPGDVRTTSDYLQKRFRISLASKPGGQFVYPPDTTDAYVYQDECVNYLRQFAKTGFPIFFELDNEPDLWAYTHAEIHPNPATYQEVLGDSIAFATSIKSVYPSTTIFGPTNYGWEGFVSLQNAPDANERDFLSFYLQGMAQADTAAQKRLLDVLDLHWYPEATGDSIRVTSDGDSPGLSDARIQAPRSLWDPTYVENSWIAGSLGNQPIDLIPAVQNRIKNYYPGTKLAFTEYNYGGANAISGAIAQADLLGLFGRYGVFASSNWGINSGMAAQVAGFNAFINFDGRGSKFGAIGLGVTGETPSQNSVYAATDLNKSGMPTRETLVVINKTAGSSPFTIQIPGFNPKVISAYTIVDQQFSQRINTSVTRGQGAINLTVPPYSVTTILLQVPSIGP